MNYTDKTITELTDLAAEAATAYYGSGDPIMSDDEFDALQTYLNLNNTGWGYKPSNEKTKVSHSLLNNLGSLDKVKYPTPVLGSQVMSPKLDGITGVVELDGNDKVLNAATRGDGFIGVDITDKTRLIFERYNICNGTREKFKGEFIITKSNFEKVKDRYSHPRNFVAGVMGSGSADSTEIDEETIELLKLIDFVPYSVLSSDDTYHTKNEVLNALKMAGFITFSWYEEDNPDVNEMKSFYENMNKNFPLDGVVITERMLVPPVGNDFSGSERGIAYKFESERATTVLKSIEWNVGSSGKITPVAIFDTVTLSGANISRASIFNLAFVKRHQLAPGARIVVTRSNEVIPVVVDVLDANIEWFEKVPAVCPSCGADTYQQGQELVCHNNNCGPVLFSRLYRVLEICGIPHGFSISNITKFFNHRGIVFFHQIFEPTVWQCIDTDKLMEEMGDHFGKLAIVVRDNILEKLEYGFYPDEFWYMLGINGLSHSISKRLNKYDVSKEIKTQLEECEATIPINVFNNILGNAFEVRIVAKLVKLLDPEVVVSEQRIKVCVTGKLAIGTRKQFFEYYKQFIVESDIASCFCLVTNELSSSSKSKYAVANNKRIMTEDEFSHYIKS